MSDWLSLLGLRTVGLVVTYLLHSSILLTAAVVVTRCARSHSLRERIWKSAAVLPLLSAPLQLLLGLGRPLPDALSCVYVSPSADVAPEISPQGGPREDRASPTVESDSREKKGRNIQSAGTLPQRLHASDQGTSAVGDPQNEPPADQRVDGAEVIEVLSWAYDVPVDRLTSPASSDHSVRPMQMSPAAWLVFFACTLVFVGGLTRMAWTSILFRRWVATFEPTEGGGVHRALGQLIAKLERPRKIRLLQTDALDEPIAFGLFRWTIVVPSGVELSLSNKELKALLAHEVAHLVRRDPSWLLVGRVLCCCLPFQPFNFVARRAWRAAAEYCCDHWAVAHTNSPLSLARCLAHFAEESLSPPVSAQAVAATDARGTLAGRIETLLGEQQRDPWLRRHRRAALAVATLTLGGLLLCYGPRTKVWAHAADRASSDVTQRTEDELLRFELDRLNDELLRLRPELVALIGQLQRQPGDAEVTQIADRIQQRVEKIRQRRRELAEHASNSLATRESHRREN